MSGCKPLFPCHFKRTCNEKCLPASIIPADKFEIASTRSDIVELRGDYILLDFEADGYPFESSSRYRPSPQCIDDIQAFAFFLIHQLISHIFIDLSLVTTSFSHNNFRSLGRSFCYKPVYDPGNSSSAKELPEICFGHGLVKFYE